MKKFAVILALSLAANVALVAAFFFSPHESAKLQHVETTIRPNATITEARLNSAQLSALSSGDALQLKAAGFPDETIRFLTVGRAYAALQARMKALSNTPSSSPKYWASSFFNGQNRGREQRAEASKAQREFADALRATFGDEASPFGTDERLAFLPPTKREQLRQIEQDYGEMQSDIYSDMNGIQLASDREKLKLLVKEKERDVAAVLSPAELDDYNLHVSQTAMNVRGRYGDAIQTEADYRKIFALQKNFDDKYFNPDTRTRGDLMSPEMLRERGEAERVLRENIRAVIGEDNYAAFQRTNDSSYKALTSLVKRLDLPATTIDSVYASRDGYAAQSQRINQDTSLSDQDRRAELQNLAAKARRELQSALGAEGAEAYAQRADWMRMLTNGTAFSTDPRVAPANFSGGSGSVYQVSPPGKATSKSIPPKG